MEAEVSPPSCALPHTHTHTYTHTHTHTHIFGKHFFTGQLPYDLCQPTHTHSHRQTHLANYKHSEGMITVTEEPLTQPVMVGTYTLNNASSSVKYGKHLCF
ncbi:hypothetical protein AMECASPLE_021155 [Ameca splendens]|uniref:Uncharacterized protein n=1 Tax=Ameca splendens TaxID=208324 RepID=A0ABV0ZP51_9TELE